MNEFKRVKFGELPGDISLKRKIAMREKGRTPRDKSYKRSIVNKGRTVQRRRDKRAIQEQ